MTLRHLALFVILALPARAQKFAVPRLQLSFGGSTSGVAPITLPGASAAAGVGDFAPTPQASLVLPFSVVSAPQPSSLPARADPALVTPASTTPDGTAAIAPSATTSLDETNRKLELPRVFTEHFSAPNSPETRRYLEMMEKLSASWSSPFDGATLNRAQLEAAEAANVTLGRPKKDDGVLYIPGGNGSWINRWARTLKRNMGVTLLWSPISNHNLGAGASYTSSRGWLWADNYGPLLTKPTSELLHEFLHAYVDRGKHARQFVPLRTLFDISGGRAFPKADTYKNARYTNDSFRSDEILTNFHTVYHRAKGIAQEYGKMSGDWAGSAYDVAPQEVQRLIRTIDTPLFLSESVEEMSTTLITGVLELAEAGLQGKKFEKNYDRFNGTIPYGGEVEEREKKDQGFYEAVVRDGKNDRFTVRFYTRGQFADKKASRPNVFPVIFGNGKYSVRVELALDKVLKHNLDDPAFQEQLTVTAARLMAPRLRQLIDVNERLASLRERLKALQLAGKQRVDLALVREIRDTAKAAFLIVAKHFIRRPARA